MSKETKRCPHCDASMVVYGHNLSKGLIGGMLRFAKMGPGLHRLCVKGLPVQGITRNQADNFQKLRYFGLVAKNPEGQRTGLWKITVKGWEFIRGGLAVASKVWTYRGNFESFDDHCTPISQIPHEPYYLQWDDYWAQSKGKL